MNFIDFIAIVPWYIEAVQKATQSNGSGESGDGGGSAAIRVVRLFRVFRIFKISRYLTWITVFTNALSESFSPLMMVLFMVLLGMVFSSSLIYFTEVADATWEGTQYVHMDSGEVSKFESIPAAFWWCIATMTTVGYGDIVPTTTAGMIISMATSLLGVIVLALPISIISANFQSEYMRLINQKATEVKQKRKLAEAQRLVEAQDGDEETKDDGGKRRSGSGMKKGKAKMEGKDARKEEPTVAGQVGGNPSPLPLQIDTDSPNNGVRWELRSPMRKISVSSPLSPSRKRPSVADSMKATKRLSHENTIYLHSIFESVKQSYRTQMLLLKELEHTNRNELIEGMQDIGHGWKGNRKENILSQVESSGVG